MAKGKVIIIGSTGSVGNCLAEILNQNGYRLHLVARNAEKLEEQVQKYEKASYAVADVFNLDQLKSALSATEPENGVKGLVYCVGSILLKPLSDTTTDDFLNTFKLNTLGAVQSIQSCLQGLQKDSGSIVLFSSVAARKGFPQHSVISMAKASLEGLVKSLAIELAPNVRINAIAPGLTKSKMAEPLLINEMVEKGLAKNHPLQRLGVPLDQANAAAFLLSDQSSWITGQILAVDGGLSV